MSSTASTDNNSGNANNNSGSTPTRKRIAPTIKPVLTQTEGTSNVTPLVPQIVMGAGPQGPQARPATETLTPDKIVELNTDPFKCKANDAIHLRLISSVDQVTLTSREEEEKGSEPSATKRPKLVDDDLSKPYHPTYTHQIIADDQMVHGYRGLHCDLWFSAASMRSYLSCRWEEAAQCPARKDVNPAELLAEKLTCGHCDDLEEFKRIVEEDSKGFVPPGECVAEMEDPSDPEGHKIEIYYDDISNKHKDSPAQMLHKRIQIMVLLFIDNSSYIDLDELGWREFFMFRKNVKTSQYSLVGFTTVYQFYNYPDKVRLRLSQTHIFTPYQRKGYGRKRFNTIHAFTHSLFYLRLVLIVDSIYNYARKNSKVADITVEDPSDDFKPVRDLSDLKAIQSGHYFDDPKVELTKELVEKIRSEQKICRQQIQKCFQVFEFKHAKESSEPDAMKNFRLALKGKIAVKFADWIQDCNTIEERRNMIDEIFKEHERDYTELLKALEKRTKH